MRLGWFVLATGLLAACDGSDSPGDIDASAVPLPDGRLPTVFDAGPDADLRDAVGPPTDDGGVLVFGPGMIADELRLAESGHSWAGWAPLVNPNFATAIDGGEMILLIELRGLDDPSGQADSDVSVAIYVGTDPDSDPDNNHTGSAMLHVAAESLDSLGNPRALLPNGSIAGGHLTGQVSGEITLFLPGIGALAVQDPVFEADLIAATDGKSIAALRNGRLSGVMRARDLQTVDNPVPTTCVASSMLDLVALPCLSFDGVQPDVDRDADGLEWFEEVAGALDGRIDLCHDGDGTTYVSTPTVPCVLDAAFQDAYTVEVEVGGVGAILLPPQ
jgi:hypothetical protein